MNTLQDLQARLRPIRHRWQRQQAVRGATRGLLVGAALMLAVVVARQIMALPPAPSAWLAPLGVAAAMGIWQLLRPPHWDATARLVDSRCGLQDRAITAWAFAHHDPLQGLELLQVRDSVARLRRVDLATVLPWQIPRWLGSALGLWLVASLIGALPSSNSDVQAESPQRQLQQDVVNRQTAEQLEESLLRDLKRLAELTGTPSPQLESLSSLPDEIANQLRQLKRPGRSQTETLATLSEIQAAIAAASRQLGEESMTGQLEELGSALAAADSLQGVADSLAQRDLEQAAAQLKAVDPSDINPLEQQTLADQLKPLVEHLRSTGKDGLAAAVEPLQQGFQQQDAALIRQATNQLAEALSQQALQLAIQSELDAQLGQLAEAKGMARSGGANITPSDEANQTWGQGRAANPTNGAAAKLDTTRQRENLSGVQGEGPTDRQTMRVEADQGEAQRALQPAFRPYDRAAEEVLRKEPLPLGYRQTIRDYFRAIRPE